MKFEITVLIILGFYTKRVKGYVADVNPRLVRTKSTASHPTGDFKNHQNLVESTSHQNLISSTTSSYDDSRIIFPSTPDKSYNRSYSQDQTTDGTEIKATQEQARDEIAIRSFPTKPISNNKKTREAQLSAFSSAYPFERDDDEYRPIWNK